MGQFTLTITPGESILVSQYLPADKPRAQVIIAPAMGVSQRYYQALALWLSARGYAVTTFDYRAMGASQNKALRRYTLNILDWAEGDCSQVLAHCRGQFADIPCYWLGHSLGGQIFPLVNGIEQVTKVITIAAGTGYWRRNAPALRKKVPLLWYLMVPLLTPLFGYFPGKKLGMVGDLPKGVIWQWRRWCLHPEYCVGVEGQAVKDKFNQLNLPTQALAFSDDEMLSVRNSEDLLGMLGSRHKQLKVVSPADYALKRIGHFGFFHTQHAERLWPELLLTELA